MLSRRVTIAAACVAIALTILAGLRAAPVVVVAQSPAGDYDRCGTVASTGTDTVTLRARPANWSAATARAAPGATVVVCRQRDGWSGVILRTPDCVLGAEFEARGHLPPACRTGWIRDTDLTLLAG